MTILAALIAGHFLHLPRHIVFSLCLTATVIMSLAYFAGANSVAARVGISVPTLVYRLRQAHTDTVSTGRVDSAVCPELGALEVAIAASAQHSEQLIFGLRNISGNIAHELARPIAMLIQHFEQRPKEPAAREAHYQMIGDQLESLQVLYNSLLNIVDLEAGAKISPEPVALSEVIREAIDMYGDVAAEKGVELDTAIEEADVFGDFWLLVQSVNNILSNAIRFSPEGSTIRLACGLDKRRPFLVVADQGPGIAESTLDELIANIARQDNAPGRLNNGLGLRLVRATMIRHGAHITVGRAVPHGLIFKVHFPLIRGNEGMSDPN